jgi:hypothetical protein
MTIRDKRKRVTGNLNLNCLFGWIQKLNLLLGPGAPVPYRQNLRIQREE